jgi:hypothetical protein
VYPGDVLVGDRDGVVVVPRALAAELAEQGLAQEQLEAYLHTRLQAGEALWGIYPPNEQTLSEYRAFASAGTAAANTDGTRDGKGGGAAGAAAGRSATSTTEEV